MLICFLLADAEITEALTAETVGKTRLPDVMSIIREASQDVSVLKGFSSHFITEFISSSKVEHHAFLNGIETLRSSFPLGFE